MEIPDYLKEATESIVKGKELSKISKARETLTENYREREKEKNDFVNSPEERMAYIASRLPSIYSVVRSIFSDISGYDIKSLLDLGAGPGTVFFAFKDIFSDFEKVTLIEKDYDFIQICKQILEFCENKYTINFVNNNIFTVDYSKISTHDLVTASYVLNELDESFFDSFANHIWNKSGKYILIVEPGTPKGFSNIKKIRDKFITLGGNVMSPCPHNNSCPITENDWCHFYSRVSRTKTQRFLKSADESYEDEKFSYILISKSIVKHSKPRIIRHPKYFKGHLELELCTENGIKNVRLSKKDKEKYKSARKSDWGMMFEI